MQFEESGHVKLSRDELAQKEEDEGNIGFQIAFNDGEPERLFLLLQLKSLFSQQLPEMPRKYILRLVFDRCHRSVALVKDGLVVGGVCFRIVHENKFAEIVFCAISSTQQVKGYGTRIMNTLKEHVKTEGIEFFLTYADNHAIGYFKKQGFSKTISMKPERYMGYIKHYNKSTLMECKIIYEVNYRDVAGLLRRQRECVYKQIEKASKFHILHEGIKFKTTTSKGQKIVNSIEMDDIPGVLEAGYQREANEEAMLDERNAQRLLRKRMLAVIKFCKKQDEAWPFLVPVNAEEVPDYYTFIPYPMDLQTMQQKCERNEYKELNAFVKDFYLVVDNSRAYNKPDTQYYSCADKMEDSFKLYMRQMKLDSRRVD